MVSDFERTHQKGSVSVVEAIAAGRKSIHQPASALIIAGIIAGVLGWIFLVWWVGLLLVGLGFLAGHIHTQSAAPDWRNWAYANVRDIHQLQRSAELERLLPFHSFDKPYGWMDFSQIQTLNELLVRFSEEEPFEDDHSVPESVTVAFFDQTLQGMGISYLQLNAAGIRLSETSFYAWNEVRGAEVVYKSYSSDRIFYSIESNKPAFGFHCREGYIEIPLEETNVTISELDYLLYVFQGRFDQKAVS